MPKSGRLSAVDPAVGEGRRGGEGQQEVSLGGGKTENWVRYEQQITQRVGSWPGGARPPTEPALEASGSRLVTIPAKAITRGTM